MTYLLGDFVWTTMGAATNTAVGSPLTFERVRKVVTYLQSPGSGLTATSSFEEYVINALMLHPPRLPLGTDYVVYSGTDSAGVSNRDNATAYVKSRPHTGLVGDTPWGQFIEGPTHRPEKKAMADKLEYFLTSHGMRPRGGDHVAALKDIMWNAGCEPYIRNAIASGGPIRGFVENAPNHRGFIIFELPTMLTSPDTVLNGYPMRAFYGGVVA